MRTRFQPTALVVSASLLIGACAREGVDETPPTEVGATTAALSQADTETAQGEKQRPRAVPPVAPVPSEARVPDTLDGNADCLEAWDAATACEWRNSADAVVIGTVRSVQLVTSNAFTRTPTGWQKASSCKAVNPALALRIAVDKQLAGSTERVVEVMVGAEQLQRWRPLPLLGENGELLWAPHEGQERGPLKEGMQLLVALHRVGGRWSLMGDTILGVDRGGVVHAAKRRGDCMNVAPDELDGVSAKDLDQLFASCGKANSARSERRRLAQRRIWGDQPVAHFAATCVDAPPGDTGEQDVANVPLEAITVHTGGAEPPSRTH